MANNRLLTLKESGGMMKTPKNKHYVLFGGTFVLANKMQTVADKTMAGLLHLRNKDVYKMRQGTTLTVKS